MYLDIKQVTALWTVCFQKTLLNFETNCVCKNVKIFQYPGTTEIQEVLKYKT